MSDCFYILFKSKSSINIYSFIWSYITDSSNSLLKHTQIMLLSLHRFIDIKYLRITIIKCIFKYR